MKNYHIHIRGRVQGVGFRPFIYREARKRGLKGWVSNSRDGVHIEAAVSGTEEVEEFCSFILGNSPKQSRIESISHQECEARHHQTFKIIDSSGSGMTDLSLTPDFAICKTCREELFNTENRRYRYPFITCTNCGPRFSIIHQVPYDRNLTTMDPFRMCAECLSEYNDPETRRFYSQTNSCQECRVTLSLFNGNGEKVDLTDSEIIGKLTEIILGSGIVAVKGIGGYLLMADATSASAIQALRKRKKRPTKPFAVMYPDMKTAEMDVDAGQMEEALWESPECPIVLCELKKFPGTGIQKDLIAPGLNRLGILMPYAPLFLLLLKEIGRPLVATSGNVTESPIIFKDDEAFISLSGIADYILSNNRSIVVPQDDSVIQYSPRLRKKIILRRSRGLAPSFDHFRSPVNLNEPVLAMGAMMKSSFAMFHQDRIFISQYLGDTINLESQENFEKVLVHLSAVLGFRPSRIMVDKHPDYPSTILGEKMAREDNLPVMKVQHHEAHAFAVLGENFLIDDNNILCVVWDGTGYGNDGQVWGGEFFHYRDYSLNRITHWPYFVHIGADRMALDPRLSLLSLLSGNQELVDQVKNMFSAVEFHNLIKMIEKGNLKTSSTGRIFDAVAALLGMATKNSYEGEAALNLESDASKVYKEHPGFSDYYEPVFLDENIPGIGQMFTEIHGDYRKRKLSRGEIALKFHLSLVMFIKKIARINRLNKIAFSGGVFQNALLVDLICRELENEFRLYFHIGLSSNDENVSFGQLMSYLAYIKKNDHREGEMNFDQAVKIYNR